MSRIRYLKPSFFKDEDLAELDHWIRILYQGLWVLADKEGRLEDRPKRIKAEIFPYEDQDVDLGLKKLSSEKGSSKRPFIIRYEANSERYIQILKWREHQKPHHTEKDSEIPECDQSKERKEAKERNKDKDKGNGESKPTQSEYGVKEQLDNREITVKEYKPASLQAVKAYFLELNSPDDAEAFFDHFESNGWKVGGRAPMKDWKAAARNWLRSPYRQTGKDKKQIRREKLLKNLEGIDYGQKNISARHGSIERSLPES